MRRRAIKMQKFDRETWIESEEQKTTRGWYRRSRAICPDGVLRLVLAGVADTWFSIPARCRYGKPKNWQKGYLVVVSSDGLDTRSPGQKVWLEFREYAPYAVGPKP